ncbi:MAG: response regulator [Anaerolineales bacterium]|jgi:signal transduction histidine kinase|nr:response regulator [Anaerolineales bacterium]
MSNTILIADDNVASRETLDAILSGENYILEMAEDGIQTLEKVQTLQPDLILLDVMMPGMDGFEVCRRIRATPGLAEIPIILLTALDDTASRLEGIESGADDFISKPIDRQELRARVRTIIRLNRYRSLLEQRERLREMAQKMVTVLEDERMRISHELHDELGQLLTAELMDIRDLQSDLTLTPVDLFDRLEKIHNQTYEIAVKIRRMAHELRPPLLSTLGLKPAIQAHCSKFSDFSHIPITLEVDAAADQLPDLYGIILYRVLQEALTNIAKHADANHAWVELSLEDDQVNLIVQDNGKGLPEPDAPVNGIGIIGMKERVSLVGGEVSIRSGKNGGTILTVSLPLRSGSIHSTEAA